METEALAIRQISPDSISSGSSIVVPEAPSRGQHQTTSPTTGQTRPHSAPLQTGGDSKPPEPASSSNQESPGSSLVPRDLYPLAGFLRAVLEQEKALWQRNELLLKSLKSKNLYYGLGGL